MKTNFIKNRNRKLPLMMLNQYALNVESAFLQFRGEDRILNLPNKKIIKSRKNINIL